MVSSPYRDPDEVLDRIMSVIIRHLDAPLAIVDGCGASVKNLTAESKKTEGTGPYRTVATGFVNKKVAMNRPVPILRPRAEEASSVSEEVSPASEEDS